MPRTLDVLCLVACFANGINAADWPQHQANAARTGFTSDEVAPSYRARWMWFGSAGTLRNQNSSPEAGDAAFTHDLTSRDGYDFPMPASVPFTLAGTVQPVVAGGRVFVGDQEGQCHAIRASDGSHLWSAANPGGTLASAAVAGNVVVFVTLQGKINGFQVSTGAPAFSVAAGKAIWGPPLVVGSRVFAGSLDGKVYAVETTTGQVVWTSPFLGAPIAGSLASDGTSIFVGIENMNVCKLNLTSGAVEATRKVIGSSFRMVWPVVHNGHVYVRTCGANAVGSEYAMENVMNVSTGGVGVEEDNIVAWMSGANVAGKWEDASTDWQTLFILQAGNLNPSTSAIPVIGPTEGTGHPPEPPCLDNSGRMLHWMKTRKEYVKLTNANGAFGTNHSMDIAGINPATGRRIAVDNGHPAGIRQETDNLYALSCAGRYLMLRQRFRGTQVINLNTSSANYMQQLQRWRDFGGYNSDVYYALGDINSGDEAPAIPETANPDVEGHAPVSISGSRVFIAESFGIVCIEHKP